MRIFRSVSKSSIALASVAVVFAMMNQAQASVRHVGKPRVSPPHEEAHRSTASVESSKVKSQRVCQTSATLQGIDIADEAVDTDWRGVHKAGTGFVFIKATEGNTFKNPLFDHDFPASKGAGIKRSPYHFFRPGDDGLEQADFFLKTVGKLDSDDLAPMLDWEVTDDIDNDLQISRALDWLKKVEAVTGKTPIVYVSPAFFNERGNPAEFAHYPLFIADWDTSCPTVPAPWTKWTFWQNSATGSVPGLNSSADIDIFGGTLDDLYELTNAVKSVARSIVN